VETTVGWLQVWIRVADIQVTAPFRSCWVGVPDDRGPQRNATDGPFDETKEQFSGYSLGRSGYSFGE
jgi:hypothetical protein